jgi:hypothetical protein
MKTNAILTDKIVAETDTKKVLELVECCRNRHKESIGTC